MHAPSRRQFLLGAVGVAGATVLAGCQSRPASLTPHLPVAKIRDGGWQQTDEVEDRVSEVITVAGTTQQIDVEAKAKVFENTNPLQQLAERFELDPNQLTIPAESFVAAKAQIDPSHIGLLAHSDTVLRRAIDIAEYRAEQTLREHGFTDIRQIQEDRLDIQAGSTATHRLYRADYPYDSSSVPYEGLVVTIEPGVLTIEAQLAVWPYRGLLVTGAGIYPGEPGHLVATASGVRRELPLGFAPERYRADVRELITHIS